MSILDRPPLHLSADDMLPPASPDVPLSIPDMVGIVRETLHAFLPDHIDLADRNTVVAPAEPLFAGMLRVTVGVQAFHVIVTEAL